MVAIIQPKWPAPKNVHACTTLRMGGFSQDAFAGFNLADRVPDDPKLVRKNRKLLKEKLELPKNPLWLTQTHSTIVVDASNTANKGAEADASFSRKPKWVCAVLTADCLPVLICNTAGNIVAAIHAGWRGLADGVIEATLDELEIPPEDTLVWLGPAIGPTAFEVGQDVYDAFTSKSKSAKEAFTALEAESWLADLYQLAKQRLYARHITQVYGGDYCTYTDPDKFYSYRRDGTTGRIATLIWFEKPPK